MNLKKYNSICIFCSSSDAIEESYLNIATELGSLIANKGIKLVHGAGKIGLMGAISRAAKKNKGYVVGVIPEALYKEGIYSEIDDEMIVTKNMHERKGIMHERSDAFIALPGGFGTLEEVLEIITLKQLRYHKKPIVILNINNYFSGLLQQFDTSFKENFAKPGYAELYYVAHSIDEAFDYLDNYTYHIADDKWFR